MSSSKLLKSAARPVDRLLVRVSEALRHLPGAEQLVLFGSCADPALKDAYSDLDLQVLSADPAASRAAFPWVLHRVAPLKLVFSLEETLAECAYSVSLSGESLYHKIDIGLEASANSTAFIQRVSPKILLWQQPAERGLRAEIQRSGYLPAPGSLEYFLAGELLSAVRYVKARRRGQHLTCWRFLSRKFNAWLACLPEAGDGPRQGGLTTWDYIALDRGLPEDRRLEMLAVLSEQAPGTMDRSLVQMTREIVNEITPRLSPLPSGLHELVRETLEFINQELNLPIE